MTLTDTQHPMKSLSAIIVDSTNTTSEYVASSTAVVLELPGHMMHQHDAPLNLYGCLETFEEFGLNVSRILQAAT
jgi:hypothetical protein